VLDGLWQPDPAYGAPARAGKAGHGSAQAGYRINSRQRDRLVGTSRRRPPTPRRPIVTVPTSPAPSLRGLSVSLRRLPDKISAGPQGPSLGRCNSCFPRRLSAWADFSRPTIISRPADPPHRHPGAIPQLRPTWLGPDESPAYSAAAVFRGRAQKARRPKGRDDGPVRAPTTSASRALGERHPRLALDRFRARKIGLIKRPRSPPRLLLSRWARHAGRTARLILAAPGRRNRCSLPAKACLGPTISTLVRRRNVRLSAQPPRRGSEQAVSPRSPQPLRVR